MQPAERDSHEGAGLVRREHGERRGRHNRAEIEDAAHPRPQRQKLQEAKQCGHCGEFAASRIAPSIAAFSFATPAGPLGKSTPGGRAMSCMGIRMEAFERVSFERRAFETLAFEAAIQSSIWRGGS